jgi:hypothetical protein
MTSKSGEILEIDYWIWNAIGEANKGYIRAQMPLEKLWCNPPYLFFMDDKSKQDGDLKNECGKDIVNDILSRGKEDQERNNFALALWNRWQKWSAHSDLSPHFRRMISGRAEGAPVEAITGALAFIARLMAIGQEGSVFIPGSEHSLLTNNMESMVIDTFEFVKESVPEVFLRDLILSEILISWYWNKTIASI